MTVYYGKNGWFDFVRLTPNGEDIPTFLIDGCYAIIHPDTKETVLLVYA